MSSSRCIPSIHLTETSQDFRRYALSTLVNTLREAEKPTPFEFLINGTFLRTSLEEYLNATGISAETLLAVEYVKAIIPPLYVASYEHDDWVSSIDVISASSAASTSTSATPITPGQERILSGSYDGLLRMWNMSSRVLATSSSSTGAGHTAAVKAVKMADPSFVVSSSLDRTIRVWRYAEDAAGSSASLQPRIELYGHKASIDSLAVHRPSSRILSASADHSVGLWSMRKSDAPQAPTALIPSLSSQGAKRRKVGPAMSIPQRGALALMKSHNAPVSDTLFAPNDSTVAYSTSWDHTLKTWDLTSSTCVDTRSTSHPLFSLTALSSLNLLAAGTSARHITLIDPRASATTVSAMTLRGHSNAVVSLATDPRSSYGLVSASHDGTCRVWDVRSSRSDKEGRVGDSTYVIERESTKGQARKAAGEGTKVFAVCWDTEVGIVSAGEDKRVQINQGKGIVGDQKAQ